MGRIYLPLEVDFDDDEKVARLARFTKPLEARAVRDLLVSMWRYCKRNRTDGHVPIEQIGKLAYPDSTKLGERDADRLVEVGLAERTEDGYYLPGYLKRNKSRAQLEEEAEAKALAGRKGGYRSGEVRRTEANVKQNGSTVLRTNEPGVLQPSEAIDRDRDIENDRDTDKSSTNSSEARKRATRIADDWAPNPTAVEWQRTEGISDLLARRELPKFRDYWAGRAGEAGRKLDWDATWRNWLRTALEREPRTSVAAPRGIDAATGKPKGSGWEFGM